MVGYQYRQRPKAPQSGVIPRRPGLYVVGKGTPERPQQPFEPELTTVELPPISYKDVPPSVLKTFGIDYHSGVAAGSAKNPEHRQAYLRFRSYVWELAPSIPDVKRAGLLAGELLRANEFGGSYKLQADLFDFSQSDVIQFLGTEVTQLTDEQIQRHAGGAGLGRAAIELFTAQSDPNRVAAALADHDYRLHD